MDDKQVMRAKATVDSGVFLREYGAVFSKDSQGFFKRSLIESCVTSETNPVILPSGKVWFDPVLRGQRDYKYVFGVDPASERDNFSIVVLELHEDHTRIVYLWSTNRKDFQKKLKAGFAANHDFYSFCARKIRDLMKVFPCEAIGIDGQGGGISVEEALHDMEKLEPGEIPIWPVIDPEKKRSSDIEPGLHILHICQFVNAEWTQQANHGLRKDMEDKVLLFPRFDAVSLGLAAEDDARREEIHQRIPEGKLTYDSFEDVVMEVEELKDELSTIIVTQTASGRDRWDVPEIKLPNGKKGWLRKDRYSALVIGNMVARQIHRKPSAVDYEVIGGFTSDIAKGNTGQMYHGPEWFTKGMNDGIVFGVNR
jgi:hypothetical protein